MKGFIACTLAMAPFFASQKLKKPIHFAYTYDEGNLMFRCASNVERNKKTKH